MLRSLVYSIISGKKISVKQYGGFPDLLLTEDINYGIFYVLNAKKGSFLLRIVSESVRLV